MRVERVDQAAGPAGRAAAAIWGSGGRDYDDISYVISDALAHAAQRLDPQRGEHVLDIATGTGWSARNAARSGAQVTAVDIAAPLLEAAQALSAHVAPAIAFRLADAMALPFPDAAFDGVMSTFGVMFAPDHARAAAEIKRVCRKGGRLSLATWSPDGAVAEFFGVLARHDDAPPPAQTPLAWGDPDHLRDLLEPEFSITFEPGVSNAYHGGVEAIWQWYLRGFGPLRALHQSLDPAGREALKRDVDAYHAHYRVDAGLHVRREYLVTLGVRR